MIYHVTCNTDDNYAQHCCAMLCSLFENNKELNFRVHILTHGLSAQNTVEINKLCKRYNSQYNIYEVDESRLEGVKFRKSRPLTKAAYYRILLPDILDKSIDRILYLDCDMIVVGAVKELFELELDDYALAATLDCMPFNSTHRFQLHMEADERTFCSGFMLINLEYWRKNNAVEKLLEYSKRDRAQVWLHDQDSLNYVFKKKWYLLPPKWNKVSVCFLPSIDGVPYFDVYEYVYHPKIIHFSSEAKPWLNVSFPYSNEYKYYLKLSGFLNPKFISVDFKDRIKFSLWNAKYYFRKYVIPFVPLLLLLIIEDVVKYLKLLMSFRRKKLRDYMLKENVKAVKRL